MHGSRSQDQSDRLPLWKRLPIAAFYYAALALMALFVIGLVLVPFYMTGGNVPSMGPGWYPDKPYELATIATYRGTVWEHSTFLQDAFWTIGCFGFCGWVPLMLLASIEMVVRWRLLSILEKRWRTIAFSGALVLTVLWVAAVYWMLYYTRD